MTKPPTKAITLFGRKYDVCSICEHTPAFCACKDTITMLKTPNGEVPICALCFHSPQFCECREPDVVDKRIDKSSADALKFQRQQTLLEQSQQRIADLEWENRTLRTRKKIAGNRGYTLRPMKELK